MDEDFEVVKRRVWATESDASEISPSVPSPSVQTLVNRNAQGHIVTSIASATTLSLEEGPQIAPPREVYGRGRGRGQGRGGAQAAFPPRGGLNGQRHQPAASRVLGSATGPQRGGRVPAFNSSNVASPSKDLGSSDKGKGKAKESSSSLRDQRATRPTPNRSAKNIWADAPLLITTQQQNQIESEKWKKKAREVYLQPLEENADAYGIGFVIWSNKQTSPQDLLGARLEALDRVRLKHQVFINWEESTQSIRICSRAELDPETFILKAIRAVRSTIEDIKAKTISATPAYIVLPPTTNSMRTIILPKTVEPARVTDIEFSGEQLSEGEREAWKQERLDILKSTNTRFEKLLISRMLRLAPDKGWLRLRVHFGRMVFSMVHNNFKEGKQSFADFSRMLKNPRTSGDLERQLKNAEVAINMKKRVLDWPKKFLPLGGLISSLEDVDFKDTEILFVTIPSSGIQLRLEAEIDRSSEKEVVEYQIGTINFFHDNNRNKRIEINMLDIEKQVDWQVQVISDNALPEKQWSTPLVDLIKSSVNAQTRAKIDPLGLSFPGVTPIVPHNIEVTSIVVRSVISYKMRDSGYVVEIAIYREWKAGSTNGIPEMNSGVSMYHPAWDYETENIERQDREREWDGKLSQFFDNGSTHESCGIGALRNEIAVVQDLLSAAQQTVDD